MNTGRLTSVLFGDRPWFQGHRRAAAAIAATLYAAVFVVTLIASSAADDVVVLYVLPISLLAVAFGRRGGVAGAAVAVGLFAVATSVTDASIGAAGWFTRATAMFLLGFLLGDATDRVIASERWARAEELARERFEEEHWRREEALELHDSVVQGIAAGIWMLDVGRTEQALDALTSTMGVAQRLVSDLLGPFPPEPGELRRRIPVAAGNGSGPV